MNDFYRGVEIVPIDAGGFSWCCDPLDVGGWSETYDDVKKQIDLAIDGEGPQWIVAVPLDNWLAEVRKMKDAGAEWIRQTIRREDCTILIEGWRSRPRNEGPRRWKQAVKGEPDLVLREAQRGIGQGF